MSNLLEQASLVMIPSGYKEDVVYSVIPTSGAGDLTFTRASNGTRIDSNGNVEVVPWNLLQYSEDFTNAVYGTVDVTITANNTTAPNGTTTADKMTIGTATSEHVVYNSLYTTILGQYSTSVYLKKGNSDYALIGDNGASGSNYAYMVINLNNGAITQTGYSGSYTLNAYNVESVGNGWYRCSITYTVTSDEIRGLRVRFSNSATPTVGIYGTITYTGNGTDFMYIWGGQLNTGTLKPYFPTTDRLNVPRLTYQNGGGGCPSLLLEKQSTNLVVQSNDMTLWTNGAGTMTKNATTSPDGTNNALSFDNTADCSTFVSASNGVYSWSLYVKQGTSATAAIDMSDGSTGDAYANFTFSSKTFSTTSSGSWSNLSTSYIECGNGWFRITLTATKNAGSSIGHKIIASGSGYTYVYGAQLEASSYPTSYIPTTSSSATRVADDCYKTGISSLIGQTEGVFYLDFNLTEIEPDPNYLMVGNLSNGISNRLGFARLPNGGIHIYSVVGGVSQFTYNTTQTIGRFQLAMAYKANDYAVYLNGTSVYTNTSASVPSSMSRLDLGSLIGSYQSKVTISETILFPTRLTNSELAQLTGNQNYTINQAYESYGVASESPNCVQP